jgi:hypothetical protein
VKIARNRRQLANELLIERIQAAASIEADHGDISLSLDGYDSIPHERLLGLRCVASMTGNFERRRTKART